MVEKRRFVSEGGETGGRIRDIEVVSSLCCKVYRSRPFVQILRTAMLLIFRKSHSRFRLFMAVTLPMTAAVVRCRRLASERCLYSGSNSYSMCSPGVHAAPAGAAGPDAVQPGAARLGHLSARPPEVHLLGGHRGRPARGWPHLHRHLHGDHGLPTHHGQTREKPQEGNRIPL